MGMTVVMMWRMIQNRQQQEVAVSATTAKTTAISMRVIMRLMLEAPPGLAMKKTGIHGLRGGPRAAWWRGNGANEDEGPETRAHALDTP
jgi:hypothetical protein